MQHGCAFSQFVYRRHKIFFSAIELDKAKVLELCQMWKDVGVAIWSFSRDSKYLHIGKFLSYHMRDTLANESRCSCDQQLV